MSDSRRQRIVQARLERAQPNLVCGGQCGLEIAQRAPQFADDRRDCKFSRFRTFGERLKRAHPPQQREYALGDERAVVLAHRRMRAEKCAKAVVGRHVEAAHALDRGRERRELIGAKAHSAFASSTRIERRRTSSVPRSVLTTRILTGM